MDFELSADQELLRDTIRRFVRTEAPVTPYVRARLDDPTGTTPSIWAGLAGLGVLGLLAGDEHGGSGRGMVDAGVVLEELGREVHPGPLLWSAVGAISLVQLAASSDEAADLVPPIVSGDCVCTVALDDAATAATRADGARARLSGTKVHVPYGATADAVAVTATEDDGTDAVYWLERTGPGVTVTPVDTIDRTRRFATIELRDAPARRLNGPSPALAIAETRDRLAVALVLDGLGAASRAMEIAVEYAKERQQFDRPIGSFQAVQHLCADMLRAVELSRAAGYYACWACDDADAAERHRAATLALAYAAEGLYRVGADTIQVLGGIGFTWEHDAHLYYKRLLTLQAAQGGAAAQLEELASIVLD